MRTADAYCSRVYPIAIEKGYGLPQDFLKRTHGHLRAAFTLVASARSFFETACEADTNAELEALLAHIEVALRTDDKGENEEP